MMTQGEDAAGTLLAEPRTVESTTAQEAPPRTMRSFWWLVALTAAMLAVLIAGVVLETTSVDEITGGSETVPAQPSSSTAYGHNGDIPGAFLPGGLPARNPSGTYGGGGEVPGSFAPRSQSGVGGSYGLGGEVPDTFASADGGS